jgi:hypothetical protein
MHSGRKVKRLNLVRESVALPNKSFHATFAGSALHSQKESAADMNYRTDSCGFDMQCVGLLLRHAVNTSM